MATATTARISSDCGTTNNNAIVNTNVTFVVGNTYQKLSLSEAKLDRTGRYKKTHDWTVFVDVLAGNDPDIIQCVFFKFNSTFHPRVYICSSPVPAMVGVDDDDGNDRVGCCWRFQTRQQSYGPGPVDVTIVILGTGGSTLETSYRFTLDGRRNRKLNNRQTFFESRTVMPVRAVRMTDTERFRIELELLSPSGEDHDTSAIADTLRTAGIEVSTTSGWKLLVLDGSVTTRGPSVPPDCNTFKLVSPVLQGGNGLEQVSMVLQTIHGLVRPNLTGNDCMGFHVHVDVSDLSHSQLIQVCQNFIKYERVIDAFIPPSRRNNESCQSNEESVPGSNNRKRHDALAASPDIGSLVRVMTNDSDRYYKLNLQSLLSSRRRREPGTTMEFCQHSATVIVDEVCAWIRFCVAFVRNSARLAPPTPFKQRKALVDKFDCLFYYVIKDRQLRNFYEQRYSELRDSNSNTVEDVECCAGCEAGGSSDRCDGSEATPVISNRTV